MVIFFHSSVAYLWPVNDEQLDAERPSGDPAHPDDQEEEELAIGGLYIC